MFHIQVQWEERFVTLHPEIRVAVRLQFDYQSAKCEDPEVVQAWFMLVRNVITNYDIHDDDIYNFDETGLFMGIISSDKVLTSSDRRNSPRVKQLGDWERVTVIRGVCTTGWGVHPYVFIKGGHHLLSWYQNGQFPKDQRIHSIENGLTINGLV